MTRVQKRQWRKEFRASEAGKQAAQRYPMYFKPDGSFRIDDITREHYLTIKQGSKVRLETTVVVPAVSDKTRESFNLGEFPWGQGPAKP